MIVAFAYMYDLLQYEHTNSLDLGTIGNEQVS